ncbi:hypothetical protein RJ641_000065 [Dillenia turbinata]|uniref:Uncharacterized protein n=1 Tax=Dillenia turbinata TaxID=194707 RepID=A0AAN8ZR52_9MAGN
MEALWNLEDKWKISTPTAFLLFAVTASALVVLCVAALLKKCSAQRRRDVNKEPKEAKMKMRTTQTQETAYGWRSINRLLIRTVRWSEAKKWSERNSGNWRDRPSPLLAVTKAKYDNEVAWQSHSSDSPVWQRPILMGEKCELPRFSGLILYDEKGQPLHNLDKQAIQQPQEQEATVVRTTLRDFL